MGIEGVGDERPLNKSEKEIIRKANQEADPTTYSAIPGLVHESGQTARPVFLDAPLPVVINKKADVYYDITDKQGAATEQIVSRLLKGIINVSDVASRSDPGRGKQFLSRKMPLDRITESLSSDEIEADRTLLALVFGDTDHLPLLSHNIRSQAEKTAYFDFDMAHTSFFGQPWIDEIVRNRMSALSETRLALLEERLSALSERIEGSEGREFVHVILESTGKSVFELFLPTAEEERLGIIDEEEFFYTTLTDRIRQALSRIQQERESRELKKAA